MDEDTIEIELTVEQMLGFSQAAKGAQTTARSAEADGEPGYARPDREHREARRGVNGEIRPGEGDAPRFGCARERRGMMPTTSKRITADAIAAFLDARDDFDLELFAVRLLKARGWDAHHRGTYTDPVTEKPRQYDVWARAQFPLHCDMLMAVECKSLAVEFPLLLSRVRNEVDSDHDLLKNVIRPQIGDTASTIENSATSRLRLYAAADMVGKAITQVRWHENGKKLIASDSDTYDKWSQCLAAATRLVRMATAQPGPDDGQPRYTFVMPVLVVSNDTLWVVDYDENGMRSKPTKKDAALLYVDRHQNLETRTGNTAPYHLSHLHIYTRKGFVELLRELSTPSNRFLERIYGWAIKQHAASTSARRPLE
jgi:hypothetical protein